MAAKSVTNNTFCSKMDATLCTAQGLPRDLLATILTFLSRKEWFKRTDLICKEFHMASKHPMCWSSLFRCEVNNLASAVEFFTKHRCCPAQFRLATKWAFRDLSCQPLFQLVNIRQLTISCFSATLFAALPAMLCCFRRLEVLSLLQQSLFHDCSVLDLPPIDSLTFVFVGVPSITTVNGLESMPSLTTVGIRCESLQHLSLPATLLNLRLEVHSWSDSVLSTIAQVPGIHDIKTMTCLSSTPFSPSPTLRSDTRFKSSNTEAG